MLRPARSIDIPAMTALLVQSYGQSKYAGVLDIDVDYTKRMLAQFVQRNGGTHDGATLLVVVDNGEGVIQGLVAGMLDRVYHVGAKLAANDVFLVAADDAPPMTVQRLLNAYLTWASNVPDCVEIRLSWTDIHPTGERMAALYERAGFRRAGEIWERTARAEERKAA